MFPRSEIDRRGTPRAGEESDVFDRMERRHFLAAAAAGGIAAATTLMSPASAVARAAGGTPDVLSGDARANPAWPFASDGLLFNYVQGIVLDLTPSSVRVLVSNPHHFAVDVQVPAGTEIYCRGSVTASISAIQIGDRIELGTRFSDQGVRVANWVVANGVSGWAYITDVSPQSLLVTPSGANGNTYSNYAPAGGNARLMFVPTTLSVDGDGQKRYGTTQGLTVGDGTTWTGTADQPGANPQNIWAIVVNVVEPNG